MLKSGDSPKQTLRCLYLFALFVDEDVAPLSKELYGFGMTTPWTQNRFLCVWWIVRLELLEVNGLKSIDLLDW